MRWRDLIGMAWTALTQQRFRTFLTLLGVVVGTTTLVISVSISLGVRRAIAEQFAGSDKLRQIQVLPLTYNEEDDFAGIPPVALEVSGTMSEEKRLRVRRALARRWRARQQRNEAKSITPAITDTIRSMPEVQYVLPYYAESSRIQSGDRTTTGSLHGAAFDQPGVQKSLEVGRPFSANDSDEIILNEFLAYQLGYVDDAQIAQLIGQEVEIELLNDQRASPLVLLRLMQSDASTLTPRELMVLGKAWTKLPEALDSLDLNPDERQTLREVLQRRDPGREVVGQKIVKATLKVVGISRDWSQAERKSDFFGSGLSDAELLVPLITIEKILLELPRRQQVSAPRLIVIVRDYEQVDGVVKQIEALGYQTYSLAEIIRQIRTNVMLITFGLNFIALVALFVAALGITTTLYSSVLERTREIGIMKAVGAQDEQILIIFLLEGAFVGFVGGVLGLLFGYIASIIGDNYALEVLAEQTRDVVPETMFRFPWWLVAGMPLFAMAVTLPAAWYPARRAARIEPVLALKEGA